MAFAEIRRDAHELAPGLWRRHAVRRQKIRSIVEQTGIDKPRDRVHALLDRHRFDGAGEKSGALGFGEERGQITQPAGLGKLGNPDHVDRKDIEVRRAGLEVDHIELMLLVG